MLGRRMTGLPFLLVVVLAVAGGCGSSGDDGPSGGGDADADADSDGDSDADADADADADGDGDADGDADADADSDGDGDRVCSEADPQPPPAGAEVEWDVRLSGEGEATLGGHGHDDGHGPVGMCATDARPGFRLVSALFETDEDGESGGNHNIYFEVQDEVGARIVGAEVLVTNGVESWTVLTEDKPPPEYAGNYPMWGGNLYRVQVAGDSDSVFNMRIPNNHHVNYLLTFQRSP